MTDKTYNGWTNYATWRVNLEIFDGHQLSDFPFDQGASDDAELIDPYELSQALQNYVEDYIYEAGGGENNIAVSYALAFLSDVNWYEIAGHMIADAIEDSSH
jgi:hypothetical protein